MEKEEQDKPKVTIHGLIIFQKNGSKGNFAVQNCSIYDVADCIISAMTCLARRNMTPAQVFALLDERARVTNIKWERESK